MGEWISVTKSHRLCRKSVNMKPVFMSECNDDKDHQFDVSLEKCRKELTDINCFDIFIDTVKSVLDQIASGSPSLVELICFGIGNFGRSPQARYQLALLSEWQKRNLFSHASFFDPQLTSGEKRYLRERNYVVLEENDRGLRQVTGPTLFYMPHCGRPLYNNLLYANWAPESLSRMAIVGNSFQQLRNEYGSRLSYVNDSLSITVESQLPFTQEDFDFAFALTSLHCFPLEQCHQAKINWASRPPPIYDASDEAEVL